MDTEGLGDPVSVEGRQTTSTSLEDRLTAAQNTRNHCQRMYRSLQRETNELTSLPTLDLLGVDIDRRLKEASGLCKQLHTQLRPYQRAL